jgi:Inositol 1,4,5-trisphosphate/ryanodine receptor/RyR and IP3R Homology associated/Ion transport protein
MNEKIKESLKSQYDKRPELPPWISAPESNEKTEENKVKFDIPDMPPWISEPEPIDLPKKIPDSVPSIAGLKNEMKNKEAVKLSTNTDSELPPWISGSDKKVDEITKKSVDLPDWISEPANIKKKILDPISSIPGKKKETKNKEPLKVSGDISSELPPWISAPESETKIDKNELKINNSDKPPWISQPESINTKKQVLTSNQPTSTTLPPWIPQPESVNTKKESLNPNPPTSDGLPPWIPQPESMGTKKETLNPNPPTSDVLPPWIPQPESIDPKKNILNSASNNLPPWISEPESKDTKKDPINPAPSTSDTLPPWIAEPESKSTKKDTANSTPSISNTLPPWISEPESTNTKKNTIKPAKSDSHTLPPWISEPESKPAKPDSHTLPPWISEPESKKEIANLAPSTSSALPPWISEPESKNTKKEIVNPVPSTSNTLPPWISEPELKNAKQNILNPQISSTVSPKPTNTKKDVLDQSISSDIPPWISTPETINNKKEIPLITISSSVAPWVTQPESINAKKETINSTPPIPNTPPWISAPEPVNTKEDTLTPPISNVLPPWISAPEPVNINKEVLTPSVSVKNSTKKQFPNININPITKNISNEIPDQLPWLPAPEPSLINVENDQSKINTPISKFSVPESPNEKIVIKEKKIIERSPQNNLNDSIKDDTKSPAKSGFIQFGDILCLSSKENIKVDGKQENFRGICIGNGISYCDLECVSKQIVKNQVNDVQFRQSLFRVEPPRQYGFLKLYLKYIKEEPDPVFSSEFKAQVDEEQEGNELEAEMTFGRTVTYGERIQLRHIHSNSFVTISTEIANEHGALKVKLDTSGSESSWLEILPGDKLHQEGEPIKCLDGFKISTIVDKSTYYLHMGTSGLKNKNRSCELNASDQASIWKAKRYITVSDLKLNSRFISTGDSFRILHKDSETYLSVAPLNIETLLPEIIKEKEGDDDEEGNLCVVGNIKEDAPINRSTDVVLEKNKSSRSLWELERLNPFKGGVASVKENFRLKNIATGLYLHILCSEKLKNINAFHFIQESAGNNLLFDTNLKIKQDSTNTFIGLIENQSSIETHFKGASIEKNSEFFLKTFANPKINLETTFVFEDESEKNSSHVYQISTILLSMIDIYKKVNIWGFLANDSGEYVPNYDIAVNTEVELENVINKGLELIKNLKLKILNPDNPFLEENQIAIRDSGLLELLLKLLQLIDIRQTFPEKSIKRKKSLKPQKFNYKALIQAKTETILLCPQIISKKYLNKLGSKIYGTLFLCVKNNVKCCNVVKNYSEFLSKQLQQYKKKVGRLLKEVFRHYVDVINEATLNEFQMWVKQLRSLNEKEGNILDQILILKIISSLCVNNDRGLRKYQLVVENFIFQNKNYFLEFFDIDQELFIRFDTLDQSEEEFLKNNPSINYMYQEGHTESRVSCINVSALESEFKFYTCAVINLLATIALSRNHSSRLKIIEHYKLDGRRLFLYINNPSFDLRIKSSLMYLLRTLFLDVFDTPSFTERYCRIFEWDNIENKILHERKEIQPFIQEVMTWVANVWDSSNLTIAQTTTKTSGVKLVIQLLSLTTQLIEIEYADNEFIEKISPSLARLLPNYSEKFMASMLENTHWCFELKKNVVKYSKLNTILMTKVLNLLDLISKFKLSLQVEYFIELYSADEKTNNALEAVFKKFSLNFLVNSEKQLNMYLLNVLLSQNEKIVKSLALEQLVKIFNQRDILKQELEEIILLQTDEKVYTYTEIFLSIDSLKKNISDLNIEFSWYLSSNKKIEEKKYNQSLLDIKYNLNTLQNCMDIHIEASELLLAQNICRNLNLHKIIIEFLNCSYPWVSKDSIYQKKISDSALPVYRSAIMVLSAFTFQNPKNQELIYYHIASIINFFGNGIGVSRLLSHISGSQRGKNKVDYIISYIMHLISLETSGSNYSNLKILKNLIIDEKHQIYESTQTNIFKTILKNNNIINYYISSTKVWNLINFQNVDEKFHATFISLLALCASQNSFVCLTCRNLLSYHVVSREVFRTDISLNLKKSYLMFILNVYFLNVSGETRAEHNVHELIEILRSIVIPGLLNSSIYIPELVQIILKSKFSVASKKAEQRASRPSRIDSEFIQKELTEDEEEALKYWKYIIDVKPWKTEQGSGLLIFIQELSIELKLSKINLSDEFKKILETVSDALQKLKAKIEGLSLRYPRINFEFFIETLTLCLFEVPMYSYEGEDNNIEQEQITENYEKLITSIRNYISCHEITVEEFFRVLNINSEIISTKTLAHKLKNELKNTNLSIINSGLSKISQDSTVVIKIEDFKSALSKDFDFKESNQRRKTIGLKIENFINNQELINKNREEEFVSLIKSIKETIIDDMLQYDKYSSLLLFSKSLFGAFQKKEHQKYLFEIFRQMIKIEKKKKNENQVKRMKILIGSLKEASIGEMAFNLIRKDIPVAIMLPPVHFLHQILRYNDALFKEKVFLLLNETKYRFEFLSCIKYSITEAKDATILRPVSSYYKYTNAKTIELEKNSEKKINLCRNLLEVIDLLCENNSENFQNFFREQKTDGHIVSINMVTEVSNLLIYLTNCEDIKMSTDKKVGTGGLALQCLKTLTLLCQGPCVQNQKQIGLNAKVYKFVNWVVRDSAKFITPRAECFTEIFKWTIKFLSSLIEGEADKCVMKVILEQVDIKFLFEYCCAIHKEYVLGNEDQVYLGERFYRIPLISIFLSNIQPIDLFNKKVIDIGLSVISLCLTLKENFPLHEKLSELKFSNEVSSYRDRPKYKNRVASDELIKKIAFNFYLENISKVEVSYRGSIVKLYFARPFLTRFLTLKSSRHLLRNITNFTYQAKIEEFFSRCKKYKQEMIYQQRLERYPTVAWFSSHWDLYQTIAFYLTCIINILLLIFMNEVDLVSGLSEHTSVLVILYILCGFQILFALMSMVANLLEYSPIIYRTPISTKNERFDPALKRIEGTVLLKEIRISKQEAVLNTPFQGFLSVVKDRYVIYSILYFIVSFLAIQNFMWYGLLILDSIKRSQVLKNVLKSITLNYKQLVLTLILTIIISYLFSIVGFLAFQGDYNPGGQTYNAYCNNLGYCFLTTSITGIRAQGGIGKVLGDPNSSEYAYRVLFDMAFFIIIIVVLLKVFFGIIIDTFAELREMRQEQKKNLSETCFICGKNKSEFKVRRISWKNHIHVDHNVRVYLTFLVYIMIKKEDFNGIEKYLKKQVLNNEISFFPRTSIELAKFETKKSEEKLCYSNRFKEIESKIANMVGI